MQRQGHWVRLNRGFRSDLRWWDLFLEDWNGVAMCDSVIYRPPEATITSDASGRWGCGAFTDSGEWFQFRWPAEWEGVHITSKELLPIVAACAVWGHLWQGFMVRCLCDNAAVVAIVRSGSSRDPCVMHLMRCLFFFTARYQLILAPVHLPGKLNVAADHLSRDALSSFLQLTPGAKDSPMRGYIPLSGLLILSTSPTWSPFFVDLSSSTLLAFPLFFLLEEPTPLGADLMAALVTDQPDWTSESWRSVLRSILRKD